MSDWRQMSETTIERRLLTMGPPVVFRPLQKTDGPLLADFYSTLSERDKLYFLPHPLDDEHAETWAQQADDPGLICIVAVQKCDECGQTLLLGYIWARDQGQDDKPWWLGVCVRPGYRSHGIGRTLFEHVFACAKAAGVKQIGLNMHQENLRALHLYQKMGFRIVEERRNEVDGLMQNIMVAQIE